MKFLIVFVLPALALASGCAPYRYHSAPVSPPALAASLEARSLDDAGLRSWMGQVVKPSTWPMAEWDLNTLTLAAYYFNPAMDMARTNAAVADAAIKTAAMKPNPSVGADAGYETAAESPYLLGFDFSLPIETAGKRGYRIAEATHLSEAGQVQVAETAWAVRSGVRAALVDLLFAEKTAVLLHEQESLQNRYVDLLEARFQVGEIPLPEVTAARIDLTNLRQALRAAEGQVGTVRAALAAAVGIPLSGLAGKTMSWTGIVQPPVLGALPAPGIRATAVENRLDVQRALAQYEAAQSRLQLEVARQYPDIDLGPGYAYEEGVHLISLRLGTVLSVRNRNEGPIAESEAQRKAAGAQLLATQSAVIAQTDKALAQYRAAYAVLEEARRSTAQADEQRRTAYQWLTSGEADQLTAVSADIQTAIAERARLDALHQTQLALGSLEDAL
ncbi:MAG TPA: TolC family protein, partial [Chthonomonadales bacterium]|nr:TolC family protein [Chthonomonadales bacterium]